MSMTPSAVASASSTLTSNVVAAEFIAPLIKMLPYVASIFNGAGRTLVYIASLFQPLLLLSPVPALAYIFAPLLVFLQIVTFIFVVSPYKTITYLVDALFPLYVFCGVACITGILLGVIARVLCRFAITILQVEDEDPSSGTTPFRKEPVTLDSAKYVKGKGRNTGEVP